MAAFSETRDTGSWLPLPAGVRRICCLGDSLTYGQGVAPRQTLAAHLNRFANMAYPDQIVWVDNRGQSSANIWHSWVPFARLSETIPFDAAILSLCHNDSHIFESNTVDYPTVEVATWLEGDRLRPILRETLADIARVSRQRDICFLLDFYSMWEGDAPLIAAVARECATLELPFVDLLQHLTHEVRMPVEEFAASPFDGHPSDNGHRAVARRLVEELRTRWMPAPAEGPVGARLVTIHAQAIAAGHAPGDVTAWALQVLEAKEAVARRQRLPTTDLADARADIERRYAACSATLRATSPVVPSAEHDRVQAAIEGIYSIVRNLDELSFALEHLTDPKATAELWSLLRTANYYSQGGRLGRLPLRLGRHLTARANAAAARQTAPELRREFASVVRKLASLPHLEALRLDDARRKLWKVAVYLVHVAKVYFDELETKVQASEPETRGALPTPAAFFTSIDVRIEHDERREKRGGVFGLMVHVDSLQPERVRRSCMLLGGCDTGDYLYRFEMPLFLRGHLQIGVPATDAAHARFTNGELRITRVEVSNNPGVTGQQRPAFVWQPAAAENTHWLRFDGLVVPS